MGYNFKKYGKDLVVENTAIIKRPNLVEVGNHVCIDVGVYLATESVIGDYVHIAPYTCIIGGAKSYSFLTAYGCTKVNRATI